MANTSKIMGLVPANDLGGGFFSTAQEYTVAASNTIVPGDLVRLGSKSDTDGVMEVVAYTTGSANVLGVCVGVQPVSRTGTSGSGSTTVDLNTPGAMVATAGDRILVNTDHHTIYEAEATGALTTAIFGLNAEISAAGYSTTTGRSGMSVDVTTAATTATLPVKILGLVRRPKNEIATAAKVLVQVNTSSLGGGTGTVGVA